MKKKTKILGSILAAFAMLAFASPVFACGGKKGKTAEKKEEQTQEKKQAEAEEDDESAEKEEEPTAS